MIFFSHLCVVKSVMTPITTMTPMSFPEGLLALLYMHRAHYPAKCCGLHLPLLNCILFISTSPMSQSAWTPGLISRGSAASTQPIIGSKCNQMQQMHLSTQHPGKCQSQDTDSSSTMALPQNPAVEGNQAADKSTSYYFSSCLTSSSSAPGARRYAVPGLHFHSFKARY